MEIEFEDGSEKQYDKPVKLADIAPKDAVVARIEGELVDLSRVVDKNCKVDFYRLDENEGLDTLRHSAAHVMADAVKRLFPDAKPTIGPVVENGFYYDFDVKKPFSPEDLKKIEAEMKKIIKADEKFERIELSKADAKKMFNDNKFKLELIEEYSTGLSVYKHGKFVDLCRGPHLPSTGFVKAVKLTKVSGAFWRADVRNAPLQRIYGFAFASKDELNQHLKLLEEAEKRDHRKLGMRLGIFSIHEEGPGFIFWKPNGMIIKNELVKYWKEMHQNTGYVLVETPTILNRKLWERSGHWKNYRENMYTLKIDEQDYAIKPMNCPGGMLIYKEDVHSYKEFPWRVGELGFVHRHELSGVLAGLFRVRAFTQDDAHIYMTPEQVEDEIINVIELCEKIYRQFGFEYHVELSTMPEKHIGTLEQWEKATQSLRNALERRKMQFKVNEGDGAFYGPKIDFHLKDCIGRTWQCGTIQVDMSQPENFDLTYEGQDGRQHRPVMIHRTCLGSIERFMGILIEHYAGKFPMWLSPDQVRVITVADKFVPYAEKIVEMFKQAGIRVSTDFRSHTVGKKIREAQVQYVNYMVVIGEKEEQNKSVNVRNRDNEVLGEKKPSEFLKELNKEIVDKK